MSDQRSCPTFVQGFHGKAPDMLGTPSALEPVSSCGHHSVSEVSPPPPPAFHHISKQCQQPWHVPALPSTPSGLLHNHYAALIQMRLTAVPSTLLNYLQTANLFWVKCTSLKQIYLHASMPLIQCNRNCMVRQGGNSFSWMDDNGTRQHKLDKNLFQAHRTWLNTQKLLKVNHQTLKYVLQLRGKVLIK